MHQQALPSSSWIQTDKIVLSYLREQMEKSLRRILASFSDHKLLLLQLEIPIETVLSAAKRAHENGLRVILNPAPAQHIPAELIALADFIIPNETELSLLTGLPVNDINSTRTSRARIVGTRRKECDRYIGKQRRVDRDAIHR